MRHHDTNLLERWRGSPARSAALAWGQARRNAPVWCVVACALTAAGAIGADAWRAPARAGAGEVFSEARAPALASWGRDAAGASAWPRGAAGAPEAARGEAPRGDAARVDGAAAGTAQPAGGPAAARADAAQAVLPARATAGRAEARARAWRPDAPQAWRAEGARPAELSREQHNVVRFISQRYRVAADAAQHFVAEAYRSAHAARLDPHLVLAVMSIESNFNPLAQSNRGAKGLMQVLARVHQDKFEPFGGAKAAFDPIANIRVGTGILREYVARAGSVPGALKWYVGAAQHDHDGGYGAKVLTERTRIAAAAAGRPVPAESTRVAAQPAQRAEPGADDAPPRLRGDVPHDGTPGSEARRADRAQARRDADDAAAPGDGATTVAAARPAAAAAPEPAALEAVTLHALPPEADQADI